jgi:hypothetical protein
MTIPAVDGRCEQCGFDYDVGEPDELLAGFERLGVRYATALAEAPDRLLRIRPEAEVWSALEYTCHVRDVLRVQRERLDVGLSEDRPTFPRTGMWRWPERDNYNAQDPDSVLAGLVANASSFALDVRSVPPDAFERPLVYSYPEPTERTIRWLVRHTAHEGQHHLLDVKTVLQAVT